MKLDNGYKLIFGTFAIGIAIFGSLFFSAHTAKASLNFDPLFEAWTGDNATLNSYYQSGALNGNASLTTIRKFNTISGTKGIAWGYSSNVSPNALSMPLTSAGYAMSFWYIYNGDGGYSGYWYNAESFYIGFSTTGQESGRNLLLHFDAVGTIDVQTKPDGTGATCQNGINTNLTTDIRDGNWHFITINSTNDRLEVYKDGVLNRSCGYYGAVDYTTNPINWFQLRSDTTYNTQSDDIALYNRPLTSDEINAIYNSGETITNFSYTYCGDNSCNGSESCSTCEADCGSCSLPAPTNYSDQSLFGFELPYYVCSNISTCKLNYAYNQNVFSQYDYVELRHLPYIGATSSDFVATSTIFSDLGSSIFGKGNGQSYLTLNGSSTLSGLNDYELIGHLASYYDYNQGIQIYATSTIGYIFSVNWYNGNLVTDITDIMNSTSTNPDIEIDTHALACSEDKWNATTTYLGINFQVAICDTYQFILDAGIKPTTYIKNKIIGLRSSLMNMFPFSLFKTIQNDWIGNATSLLKVNTAYASDFSTSSSIIASSSFSISLPNFLGSGATSTLDFFSKQNIINWLGQDVFNIYFIVCRVLIYGLFFSYLWHLITDRADQML